MKVLVPPVAPATQAGYNRAVAKYEAFAAESGLNVTAPSSVAEYFSSFGCSASPSLLWTYRCALTRAFLANGVDLWVQPDLRRAFTSALKAARPVTPRAPRTVITEDVLRQIIDALPHDQQGARDRALILLCYATCATLENICQLKKNDVIVTARGLEIVLRAARGDRKVRIVPSDDSRYCAVAALRFWMTKTVGDYVFVSLRGRPYKDFRTSAWREIDVRLQHAGLENVSVSKHRLRDGFVVSALRRNISIDVIRRQAGLRTLSLVRRCQRYRSALPNLLDVTAPEEQPPWEIPLATECPS